MKRGFLIILLIIIIIRVYIVWLTKYYDNPSFEEISNSDLKTLEKDKETFLIMVYTTGCFSCMDFEKVLTEFTKINNIQVLRINITDIENTKLAKKIKYTPTLVIYHNGKVYKYLDANSNEDVDYYKSPDNLKTWLDKYILLTSK